MTRPFIQTHDPNVKRVLIHRQGSLGDTVVALPALHAIARAFPNAERRLLTNFPVNSKAAPALDLVAPCGLVHGSMRYPVETRQLGAILRLAREVRAWCPDVAVYLVEARTPRQHLRDKVFMRLCGVRRLVGYDTTGAVSEYRPKAGGLFESEAERLARAMAEIGPVDLGYHQNWSLGLTRTEQDTADALLATLGVRPDRPIVAFSIGTKAQANDYEDDNWRTVIASMGRRFPEIGLVGLGAPQEKERTDALLEHWPRQRLNACGTLGVRESAAVLARCSAFVGHDSGPMHLAAAMGTPCVAIFSSRNRPGIWHPYGPRHSVLRHETSCAPCGLFECVREGKRCILSIKPDAVVEALASKLDIETASARTHWKADERRAILES